MTSTLRPRSIPPDGIIVREIETETLLYDESTHRAWCLNRSSACIWRLCDGSHTVQHIAEAAGRELNAMVSEDLVLLTVEELREKNLMHEASAPLLANGISRRTMLGRTGIAAAALLPVIAAIVAPPALALTGSGGTGNPDALSDE